MSDEKQPKVDTDGEKKEPETLTVERNFIHELREEAKANRLKAKALQDDLDKVKQQQEENERAKHEEQGEFKKLYEDEKAKVEQLTASETRLKQFEQALSEELDGIKKTLSDEDSKTIDDLDGMPIEKRLQVARRLSGATGVQAPVIERPGAAPTAGADALMKEYNDPKTSDSRKFQILGDLERNHPKVYANI